MILSTHLELELLKNPFLKIFTSLYYNNYDTWKVKDFRKLSNKKIYLLHLLIS